MQQPEDLSPFETYLIENEWTYYATHDNGLREYKDSIGRRITMQFYKDTWIIHSPSFGLRQDQSKGKFHHPVDFTLEEIYQLMQVVDFADLVSMTKTTGHIVLAENDRYYHVHKWPWNEPKNRTVLNM